MALTVTKDRFAKVLAAIRQIDGDRVLVGVPADKALRDPDAGEPTAPINNAAIAYIMEYGAPEANIPARPSIHPGIITVKDEIGRRFKKTAQAALDGKPFDVSRTLNQVGLVAQAAIREKITDGPFVPLAPMTLSRRKAKGRTGEKPLIDTGQFRNSINYVVKMKGAA